MRALTGWKDILVRISRLWIGRFSFLSAYINQILHHDLNIIGAWHLVHRAEIEGDYLEFGVYKGDTFRLSLETNDRLKKALRSKAVERRFFAFDSFQGLPASDSINSEERNFYHEGEFASSEADFRNNLGKYKKSKIVHVIPGWFKNTLIKETSDALGISKAAMIVIDCDLYESTLDALQFCTPFIQTGTLLYFDDWFSLKGSLFFGEAKACKEWLRQNPEIQLVEYRKCGITGVIFLVQLNQSASSSSNDLEKIHESQFNRKKWIDSA